MKKLSLFDFAVELVRESQQRSAAECLVARRHVFPAGAHRAGFASGVHVVVNALSLALLQGRVFTFEDKHGCSSATAGHTVDIACAMAELYRAPTNCSAGAGKADVTRAQGAGRFKLSPQTLAKASDSGIGLKLNGRLRRVPAFFWASVLASYLLQPKPCVAEALAALEGKVVGDASRALAVHARFKDKGVEALLHEPGEYAEAASALVTQNGYAAVFICSDDLTRAKQIRKAILSRHPVQVVVVGDAEHSSSSCGGSAVKVATEIALMAKAHAVVGTLSSNVGRLVHELRAARTLRSMPLEEDDAPLNAPSFFDLDGLAASWLAGDGEVENGIRGFWLHYALQHSLRCRFASIHSHSAKCDEATSTKPPGLYDAKGTCIQGCRLLKSSGSGSSGSSDIKGPRWHNSNNRSVADDAPRRRRRR